MLRQLLYFNIFKYIAVGLYGCAGGLEL